MEGRRDLSARGGSRGRRVRRGLSAGGSGGKVVGAVAAAVGLLGLLVTIATIADMVNGRGRAVHAFQHGMALPDGRKGWYVVAWATAVISTIGGSYDVDGRLLGNPDTDWRVGVVGRDAYVTMLEVDDGLAELYQHALRSSVATQFGRAVTQIRQGHPITIGDITLGPGGYQGTATSGVWDDVTGVRWDPDAGVLKVDHTGPEGRATRSVSRTPDTLPNSS